MQSKPDVSQGLVKDPNSKTQARKMKKLEAVNAKKAQKAREKEQSSIPFATLKLTEDSAVGKT
jgi:tryptophanyl-tRNA synthetase